MLKLVREQDRVIARLAPQAIQNYNEQPDPQQYQTLLAEYRRQQAQRAEKPRTAISISEMGKCAREIGYNLAGYQPTEVAPDPATRETWDLAAVQGEAIHRAWQGALAESGLARLREQKPVIEEYLSNLIEPAAAEQLQSYNLVGRIDLWLEDGTLCEIKSVAGKNFDVRLPWFSRQLKLEQSALYMWFLGVAKTRFIVVRREAANWFSPVNVLELDYVYRPAMVEGLLDKATLINAARQSGELPPPQPGPDRRACRFCGFKQYCPTFATDPALSQPETALTPVGDKPDNL